MRIIFMGTPQFAVPCLAAIHKEHEVLCVVTRCDAAKGRGKKVSPPPVKEWAIGAGVEVFQPESLREPQTIAKIKNYNPDVIVVVAYGKILPKEILDIPRFGCINVHASILPKYRGAAPVQWAIINGEKESGVCTMLMDEGLDTGDVIEVERTNIKEFETAGELLFRLSEMGARLILSTLSGGLKGEKQLHDETSYAPMITKDMAKIEWSNTSHEIINLIRGMNPSPIAHTTANGEPLKIFSAFPAEGKGEAGSLLRIDADNGAVIATGDSAVYVGDVRPASGKCMTLADYLRGHRFERLGEV